MNKEKEITLERVLYELEYTQEQAVNAMQNAEALISWAKVAHERAAEVVKRNEINLQLFKKLSERLAAK
jgi:lysylphosphatidylglycerol synthetase-like protein (DUF2156 family)